MKTRAFSGSIIVAAATLLCTDAGAAQRTFVASYGSDANACTIPAPCRSFGAAIGNTTANGEIVVIDTAGYGPVTVTKSVSIIAPAGVYAGISVASGASGVTINAPGIHVRLKGLAINGASASSGSGVNVLQGSSVSVEDCEIANMGQYGLISNLAADVTISSTTIRRNTLGGVRLQVGSLSVVDSHVIDNGNAGILVEDGKATITRTLVAGNTIRGISLAPSTAAGALAVTASTMLGNGTSGISVNSPSAGAPAHAAIAGNTLLGNGAGGVTFSNSSGGPVVGDVSGNQVIGHTGAAISTSGTPVSARVSANRVFVNGIGLAQGSGTLFTLGDNYVRNNTPDLSGTTADSPL